MSDEILYKLLYALEHRPEGVAGEDLEPSWGACDAALVAALTYPVGDSGDVEVVFESKSGVTGEALPDSELFKVWLILARRLGRSGSLTPAQRVFCETVWTSIFEVVMTQQPDGEGTGEQ